MADVKRTNYFDRQFLRARDVQDEQAYHLDQRRRHNRLLHTPGVAEGLVASGSVGSTSVTVSAGVAVDAGGREIVLSAPDTLTMPTGQASVDIFISYGEEPSDPSADPGVVGFTRITERPNLGVAPAGTVPAGGVLLARAPLNLANGQLTGAVNNSVRTIASTTIGDGTITEVKLANTAVSTRTIQDNAVNAAKILDGSVGNAELANNAVTAPKIADNAVTAPKIADNAVTAPKIADSSVTTLKLADNAVTAAKLQSHPSDNILRAVGKQHIQNNSVSIAQLSGSLVLDGQVSISPIGGGEVAVTIQEVDEHAFYLISVRIVGPRSVQSNPVITWRHRTEILSPPAPNTLSHRHQLFIQNLTPLIITVSYKVYRINET